ncbi:hypothetical protein CSC17_0742 [Klebsiella oxytoca]|nr:hypothetical protein CSC17_0742 [Klebsiella oxytoca]
MRAFFIHFCDCALKKYAVKLDAYQFWYDQCTVHVILDLAEWFQCRNLLLIKGYINNF